MEMVLVSDTLYVDLSGEVDTLMLKNRLYDVSNKYGVNNVIVNALEVFNYKKKDYDEIRNDYSKVFKGSMKIIK